MSQLLKIVDEQPEHVKAKKKYGARKILEGPTYPVVHKGRARIRVLVSAAHTGEDLEYALQVFRTVGKEYVI